MNDHTRLPGEMIPPQSGAAELEHALEEASLLREDDPRRIEAMRRLKQLGPGNPRVQQLWIELCAETERLRLELRAVSLPDGFEDRLMKIPSGAPRAAPMRSIFWRHGSPSRAIRHRQSTRLPHHRTMKRRGFMAAVLSLAVVALAAIWMRTSGISAANHFAELAMHDHRARPSLTVTAAEATSLQSALTPLSPFEVHLPSEVVADSAPLGGRICSFGEKALIYTRWRDEAGEWSLYQVRRKDFSLAADMFPRQLHAPATAGAHRPCEVNMWTDGPYAYALVRDAPEPPPAPEKTPESGI